MAARILHGALVGALLSAWAGMVESLVVLSTYPYHRDYSLWWKVAGLYFGFGSVAGALAALALPLVERRRRASAPRGPLLGAGVAAAWFAVAGAVHGPELPWYGWIAGALLLHQALGWFARHDSSWTYASFFMPLSCVAGCALVVLLGAAARLLPIAACPGTGPTGPPPPPGSPNVLLVALRGVGAERLGCYGHFRPTSPALDRLAEEGILYEQALAAALRARPALEALLGAPGNLHFQDGPPLAQQLHGSGWQCAGFMTSPATPLRELLPGFDRWWNLAVPAPPSRLSLPRWLERGRTVPAAPRDLVERFLSWVEQDRSRERQRPFFALMELDGADAPFRPPTADLRRFLPEGLELATARAFAADSAGLDGLLEGRRDPAPQELEALSALHDAEILGQDRALRRLFHGLQRLDLLEETLVIVVGIGSHGFRERPAARHGPCPWPETARVPLLLRHPKSLAAGTRVAGLVSTADVPATVLEFLDLAAPAPAPSLLAEMRGRPGREAALIQLDLAGAATALWGEEGVLCQGRAGDRRLGRFASGDLVFVPEERWSEEERRLAAILQDRAPGAVKP